MCLCLDTYLYKLIDAQYLRWFNIDKIDSVLIKIKSAKILISGKSKIMMADYNSTKDQHNYSDSKVFVFTRPRLLDLKGIWKVSENSSQFKMMMEYIKTENKNLLNSNKKFIAIFNDKFESIRIKNCYKRCYPNPEGCKIVKFVFTSQWVSSHAKIIRNYLSQINERTKIKLKIWREIYNWIYQLIDDFLELKNLSIHFNNPNYSTNLFLLFNTSL